MHYKTIMLELLQQHPRIHEQLRQERKLLTTMETLASELKTCHEMLTESLATANRYRNLTQISSEAMELAIRIMQDRLRSESPLDKDETLSLDQAMDYIKNHT